MTDVNYDKRDQIQNPDGILPVQAHFLTAISQLNPEVLLSLKALSNAQTRSPTRRELKQWARHWNLKADWVVDWVAHTIRWQREGPSRRWDRFYHPRWSLRSRYERKPATINVVIKRRIEGAFRPRSIRFCQPNRKALQYRDP